MPGGGGCMPKCYLDAHGGVLVTFGSWGPKVEDWPVASWADKPLTSFGVACFGHNDLARFWALEPTL